jgi:anti-sigma regulatory factor (Ser/Thr protein kinase)
MTAAAQPLGSQRQELVVVSEPSSARRARAWLCSLAAGLGRMPALRLQDLELVFAEVVANAIRHGAPGEAVIVAATPKPEFLCVQVTDEGPGLVPRPGAMGSDEYGGFGLFIVERLTRRWGVTRENDRTRVWFEFDYS